MNVHRITRVHASHYLDFLQHARQWWEEAGFTEDTLPTVIPARRKQQRIPVHIDGKLGYFAMAIDTAITRGTWQAATSSAACAQSAAIELNDTGKSAFALCRTPGHHAASDLYGGYCFLDNAAIAAQTLLGADASRVAIVDVDFHHGNGGGYAVEEIGIKFVNFLHQLHGFLQP